MSNLNNLRLNEILSKNPVQPVSNIGPSSFDIPFSYKDPALNEQPNLITPSQNEKDLLLYSRQPFEFEETLKPDDDPFTELNPPLDLEDNN